VKAGLHPTSGEHPLPCKQPNQSTRERWNLQHSFSPDYEATHVHIFMLKVFPAKAQRCKAKIHAFSLQLCAFARIFFQVNCGSPHLLARTKPI
jgi:hypothetical protein